MRVLFLDSLTLELSIRAVALPGGGSSTAMIDVGSGAGIPGLPLKILHPNWRLTLVESIAKKAEFLRSIAPKMGLDKVDVIANRAEEVALDAARRDAYDIATARAVAPLPTLIELCAPFVRAGGTLLFPKSGDVDEEVRMAVPAARELRLSDAMLDPVPAPDLLGQGRWIVRYEKLRGTPKRYPRRVGLAKSQPILAAAAETKRATPRGRKAQPE